jgi:hypothetical protein
MTEPRGETFTRGMPTRDGAHDDLPQPHTDIVATAVFDDPDTLDRQFLVRDRRGGWRVEPAHGNGTAESPRWHEVTDPRFGHAWFVREAGGCLSFMDARRVPQVVSARPLANPWGDAPDGAVLLDKVLAEMRAGKRPAASEPPPGFP